MRQPLYILLTILLITFVMGCSRSVDKRLVLADSLMWTAPDSALHILNAINSHTLQGDENQPLVNTSAAAHHKCDEQDGEQYK